MDRRREHNDKSGGHNERNNEDESLSSSQRPRDRHRRSDDEDEHKSKSRRRRRDNVRKKRRKTDEDESSGKKRRKKRRGSRSSDRNKRGSRKRRTRRRREYSSSSSSGTSSSSVPVRKVMTKTKKIVNKRLLQKLATRGETLEEREERREQRRAARIKEQFGYTAEDNPFNDPNIASPFSWKKKEQQQQEQKNNRNKSKDASSDPVQSRKEIQTKSFLEIEKVRKRREDYHSFREEMERIRVEESRMKELEHYDEWERKEEEFHLQQQRQRSAIRLVEGRERPIDVLAKNVLLFGLTDEEKRVRASVKYKERYNALDEMATLEVELEEPHVFLRDLKLKELEELLNDIDAFRTLEGEVGIATSTSSSGRDGDGGGGRDDNNANNNVGATSLVLEYWDALDTVVRDEIRLVQAGDGAGGEDGNRNRSLAVIEEVRKLFEGQSTEALQKMRDELHGRLTHASASSALGGGGVVNDDEDQLYWRNVLEQLLVHLAKVDLSDMHSKMLICQLEKLERKKDEIGVASTGHEDKNVFSGSDGKDNEEYNVNSTKTNNQDADKDKPINPDFGNLEEELGLSNEIDLSGATYAWREKYRPRKPRYFNRVKTGYDWNKYNQMHYDHDNPPPKTVQGYKFNVFYPDLVDRTTTPSYALEPADTGEFCIIRFHAGPPYEDVAFKIINKEWNSSRKRGFRSTFERGVLCLYFNFSSHWYRR